MLSSADVWFTQTFQGSKQLVLIKRSHNIIYHIFGDTIVSFTVSNSFSIHCDKKSKGGKSLHYWEIIKASEVYEVTRYTIVPKVTTGKVIHTL